MHITRKKVGLFFPLLSLILCLTLSPRASAGETAALSLPDVPGWSGGELRTTNLDTVSGNQGIWLERDYRTASGVPVHAALMAGKGARMPRFPLQSAGADDGPLGSGCTYRTMKLDTIKFGARDTIVETHPLLGVSVTVSLDGGYLTLESREDTLTPEDAALLISAM